MFSKDRRLYAVMCLRSAPDRLLPTTGRGNTLVLPQDRRRA
jgi:hypothetical protein